MYSQVPEAILLGLGYTNDIIDELRQSCKGLEPGVPWLTGGFAKTELEEMLRTNPPPPPSKQGPITAEKLKTALAKLLNDGKGGQDGLYFWYKQ